MSHVHPCSTSDFMSTSSRHAFQCRHHVGDKHYVPLACHVHPLFNIALYVDIMSTCISMSTSCWRSTLCSTSVSCPPMFNIGLHVDIMSTCIFMSTSCCGETPCRHHVGDQHHVPLVCHVHPCSTLHFMSTSCRYVFSCRHHVVMKHHVAIDK